MHELAKLKGGVDRGCVFGSWALLYVVTNRVIFVKLLFWQ